MFGFHKLTWGNSSPFFLLGLLGLLISHFLFGLPLWIGVVWLSLYLAILVYGSCTIGSGFFVEVQCSANTQKKEIAISFDDGPVEQQTAELLQVLREHEVKAAFFCIGRRVASNPVLVKQMHEEGHLIGNHSYSHHFWFDLFSTKKMLQDMQAMDQATLRAMGRLPKLFRPPYGVTNPILSRAIKAGHYIPIGWSVRSLDTVIRNKERLIDKILRQLKPGGILLLHDTGHATVAILPSLIHQIRQAGYQIIRLDKMLNLEPYA